MPQDLTDDKSTLVQAMAWCRQATSHYLNQCWPRSPTPYGVIRPQWVNQFYETHEAYSDWAGLANSMVWLPCNTKNYLGQLNFYNLYIHLANILFLYIMKLKYNISSYHQISNIRHALVGNKLVDHLDVVGASPVGAAPSTASFST